jgi:hypothetical protein
MSMNRALGTERDNILRSFFLRVSLVCGNRIAGPSHSGSKSVTPNQSKNKDLKGLARMRMTMRRIGRSFRLEAVAALRHGDPAQSYPIAPSEQGPVVVRVDATPLG